MTLPDALNSNEIIIDNYRLPIDGAVSVSGANQYAGKITIGETSHSDQNWSDEWIEDDWKPGMLKKELDEQVDRGRWWKSSCTTYIHNKLLPPSHSYIKAASPYPTGEGTHNVVYLTTKGTRIYGLYATSKKLYYAEWDTTWSWIWNNTAISTFAALSSTASDIDSIQWNSKIYITDGLGALYEITTAPTPPTVAALSPVKTGTATVVYPKYFTLFDTGNAQKVICIDTSGKLWASTDMTNWDDTIGGSLPSGVIATDLLTYRNAQDEPTVFICTNKGLYSVDLNALVVYPTSLTVVPNSYNSNGIGSIVHNDGNLYFSDKLAIWRYPKLGQITNIGLDRDDGIPYDTRGRISSLISHPNFIIASIRSSTVFFAGTTTTSTGGIFIYDGSGWHQLASSSINGENCVCLSYEVTTGNMAAVVYSDLATIYTIWLPEYGGDSAEGGIGSFSPYTGTHITGWFDAGASEIQKIASSLKVSTRNLSSTYNLAVSYQTNLCVSDSASATAHDPSTGWEPLVTFNNTNLTNGIGKVYFPSNPTDSTTTKEGYPFYKIRLKFDFVQVGGSTILVANIPIMYFFNLKYRKMPDPIWAFSCKITGRDSYPSGTSGVPIQTIWNALEAIKKGKKFVKFIFKADTSTPTHYVEITGLSGIMQSGPENTSSFNLSVVEIDPSG